MTLKTLLAGVMTRPLTVNHDTLRLYNALEQQLKLNEHLQKQLLEAAEVIETLTKALNESR